MKKDLFQAPDYYNLDDLLTDEHKLINHLNYSNQELGRDLFSFFFI